MALINSASSSGNRLNQSDGPRRALTLRDFHKVFQAYTCLARRTAAAVVGVGIAGGHMSHLTPVAFTATHALGW